MQTIRITNVPVLFTSSLKLFSPYCGNAFVGHSLKIMMSDSDWLERATVFDLGTCIFHNRPVKIEARPQLDGNVLWVLKMQEWVLGKDSDWHWEPLPSSRTDEFIKNTRFESPNEAHSFWVANVNEAVQLKVG